MDRVRREDHAAAGARRRRTRSDRAGFGPPTAPSGTNPTASVRARPFAARAAPRRPRRDRAIRPPCVGIDRRPSRRRTGSRSSDQYRHSGMRALIQRVERAAVQRDRRVAHTERRPRTETVGEIGPGLCVLVGVTHDDDRGDGPQAGRQDLGSAGVRRRRRRDEPAAGRHGRRGARRQPVHALRRHDQGPPPELDRGRSTGARRTARRRRRRVSCARSGPPSRPVGSAPRCTSSSSTTARSRCCSRSEPSATPVAAATEPRGDEEHDEDGDDPWHVAERRRTTCARCAARSRAR